MDINPPKVTIIMATYNRAHFIVESLESINKQTFTDWECFIIDDGGTDNTLAVISPLLSHNPRFNYLKRPDNYLKGLPGCRNYGIDLAQGNYVIFFDDDDIVHPQNLELCVFELSKNEVSFCRYQRAVFFDEFNYNFDHSKIYTSFNIDLNDLESMLTNKLPFNSCAVMWKRECFVNHRFVEHLMYAEEWELYSRILSSGFKGISINKILFYGRKHQNSNTGEYYSNETIRVNSKKQAIKLVAKNLIDKNLLTPNLHKFLTSFSISFRDEILLNDTLNITKTGTKKRLYLKFKFYSFPLWKLYNRMIKK